MKALIITNNPKVNIEKANMTLLCKNLEIEYREDAEQDEILKLARDRIHLGAKLVIHPMMGRIKPHETPYKSVFLEIPDDKKSSPDNFSSDVTSIMIIEESIAETLKFLNNTYRKKYDESFLPDLQYLDYLLLIEGLKEYSNG